MFTSWNACQQIIINNNGQQIFTKVMLLKLVISYRFWCAQHEHDRQIAKLVQVVFVSLILIWKKIMFTPEVQLYLISTRGVSRKIRCVAGVSQEIGVSRISTIVLEV